MTVSIMGLIVTLIIKDNINMPRLIGFIATFRINYTCNFVIMLFVVMPSVVAPKVKLEARVKRGCLA